MNIYFLQSQFRWYFLFALFCYYANVIALFSSHSIAHLYVLCYHYVHGRSHTLHTITIEWAKNSEVFDELHYAYYSKYLYLLVEYFALYLTTPAVESTVLPFHTTKYGSIQRHFSFFRLFILFRDLFVYAFLGFFIASSYVWHLVSYR